MNKPLDFTRIGRRCLPAALAGLGLLLGSGLATAQDWDRPIRLVVPAAPGGSADPMARLIAEELTHHLPQPVIVDNRPGANGNIGASQVAKSRPDGHTLLLGWPGTIVSAVTLYGGKSYHPIKDFDPIVMVGSVPNVILVHPSLPVKNFAELTQHLKQNPGKLNFGSTGSGSSYHLSGELYKKAAGLFIVHVPYTSPGAVFADLLAGRLQLAFPGMAAATPFTKDGRLRPIAVMARERNPGMPEVPTTVELGQPSLVSETWFGVLAPKGTPVELTRRINTLLNNALKNPDFRKKLVELGYTPLGGTPQQFSTAIEDDIVKWGEVVKFSGAKVD